MSQTTHSPDLPNANDTAGLQEFLGFSDLEAELLGPHGAETAASVATQLAALDQHLTGLEKVGLPREEFETVLALKKAVRAAGIILASKRAG